MEKVIYELIVTIITLVLGIWGLSSNNVSVAVFLIVMGVLFAIATLFSYSKEYKKKKS